MPLDPRPRATYRLQLRPGFGFDEAAALVDYLAALGVSHLYCSPILEAVSGSTHGYDVVDHGRLREQLGGAAAYERLTAALGRAGLGQLLDIVPNHMAVSARENAWWWDVLENGPSSLYAAYFDIDWDPPEAKLRQTVLLPILGDHYGRVLEAGDIRLEYDKGGFVVRYADHAAPVSPRSLDSIVAHAAEVAHSAELADVAAGLGRLPPAHLTDWESVRERHRDKEVLRTRLACLVDAEPAVRAAIDATVAATNADPDALDALLQRQNYRLARWQTAGRELDYRRFFDVPTLVALRTEEPTVFHDTHAIVLDLVRARRVQGLRVDHPDGLVDPQGYLDRLRAEVDGAWIVVEKILAPDERLPRTWPVEGTTGYEWLNAATGIFVDPGGEEPLTELYARFTGDTLSFAEHAWRSRQQVLRTGLAADVERLTAIMVEVCERHRRYRDYTRGELRDVLRETLAGLGVYRTYVRPDGVRPEDVARVDQALDAARARRPDLDADLFGFLRDVLLLRERHDGDAERDLAARLQQVSAAVMAKGVEDTAFYRYTRLVALNEVGGDPARFGTSVDELHRRNAEAAAQTPATLLATSTHDTKRSEDVRARLVILSQMPERWASAVWRWAAMNARHRRDDWPDRGMEYLLYQTLVGAHPLPVERAVQFMEKAAREAKLLTSWIDPQTAYEEALRAFVGGVCTDASFTADLEAFLEPLVEPARTTSLAQTLLKLASPGVADLYQGTELWDASLVDPDNRRPVDFEARRALLASLDHATPEDVRARAETGAPKLWLIRRALDLRRRLPAAFDGDYVPLAAEGPHAERVVGFVRGGAVVTVVPRLVLGLEDWGATTVALPSGAWTNELTGDAMQGGHVALGTLLARFPVALLRRS